MNTNFQVVLLSAGESSRMYPLNNGNHKSMIKLLGKPILEHTIEKLKAVGLKDLIIVASNDKIKSCFGDGEKFGVTIKYAIQEKPEGAGNALLLCKDYLKNDFILMNSYHIDIDKFINKIIAGKTDKNEGVLLVKKTDNPGNYGIIGVNNDRIDQIVEKPEKGKQPSDYRIVGVYLLGKSFIQTLKETPPEHYQLETALNNYVKGHRVSWIETKEDTVVLKFPWDLLKLKDYLLSQMKPGIGENINISKSAQILGDVLIEDGVKILDGAIIKGPCYLGKGCQIGTNSLIRKGTVIEQDVVVGAYMEIANSILMQGVTTHSGFIGDSIIGEGTKIGAQFSSANVRIDRKPVASLVKGQEVETGLNHFGFVIGNKSRIGIKSATMPGVIIGSSALVGPSTTVLRNVGDGMKYYTKFQEIIEK